MIDFQRFHQHYTKLFQVDAVSLFFHLALAKLASPLLQRDDTVPLFNILVMVKFWNKLYGINR